MPDNLTLKHSQQTVGKESMNASEHKTFFEKNDLFFEKFSTFEKQKKIAPEAV